VPPLHGQIAAIQTESFQVEARAAACLDHSHSVPMCGVGEHDAAHFYAIRSIGPASSRE
jgi:hypothetical protein